MFGRCPFCKRFFQAKKIRREPLGNPYEVQEEDIRGYPKQERIENFRTTYKCKSCGREWTDVNAKMLHDHLHF